MINSLAVVSGTGLVVLVVIAAAVAVVGSYLFLRANPEKKAAIDKEVDKLSKELKR